VKELVLKYCKRCGHSWCDNNQKITLYPGEPISLIRVDVSWCLLCADSYEKEIDQSQQRKFWKDK